MDWTTAFSYTLIASILLIAIGIYALITSKGFIRIIIGIEMILMAAVLLLVSMGTGGEVGTFTPDSMAQTLAVTILIIGAAFAVAGTSLEKRLRKVATNTEFDFNFETDETEIAEEVKHSEKGIGES
ncbi:MAG: NADH-quinone oxidoreductase subunit K [Candidatus Heimdallarchaeota archaeon]